MLANDTDPQSLPLTAVVVSGPAHGNLTLNADGSFTYTPNAGFYGSDSFTYRRQQRHCAEQCRNRVDHAWRRRHRWRKPTASRWRRTTLLTVTGAQGVLANDTDAERRRADRVG